MGLGNLMRDVKPEAKTFSVVMHGAAIKRLEKSLHGQWWNRLPCICYRELKTASATLSAHMDGLILGAIRECVAKKIGEKLGDAGPVATHRLTHRKRGFHGPIRIAYA